MIDLTYLTDVTDGDTDSMRQLIEMFLIQSQEITENFKEAESNNDAEAIGRIAHLAKSTSKVMGISDVSDKMQELQGLVDNHEHPERYGELVGYYYSKMPVAVEELKQKLAEI